MKSFAAPFFNAVAALLARVPPHVRFYGPRVHTNRNVGRHYGLDWSWPRFDQAEADCRKDGARVYRSWPTGARSARYVPHQSMRECSRRLGRGRL